MPTKHERHPLFNVGGVLRERWLIQDIIGKGGYGQIFMAIDQTTNQKVAVKAEPTHRRGRRTRRMQRVLLLLQGRPHAPIMAIAGFRDLHHVGFIHRDIKPANIVFGITNSSKHRLIIIDYGLVRQFRNEDGSVRSRRPCVGFRGTLRYVSLRVHERQESGPVIKAYLYYIFKADDLISLFYTFLELIRGSLPWRHLHHSIDVQEAKEELLVDLCNKSCKIAENISDSIREFGRAVSAMNVEDEPNYSALQDMMKDLVGNAQLNDPYDWQNDYTDVIAEVEINRALGLIT